MERGIKRGEVKEEVFVAEVRLKDITKKFKDVIAVDNVSLDVRDGEFLTLVGPSGCGKSTTLRAVAGLESPTSGDIFIDGERVNDLRNLKESLAGEIRNLGEKIKIQEEEIAKIKERLDSLSKAHREKADALGQSDEAVRNLSREIDGHQKNIRNAKTRTVDLLAFQTNTKNDLIKLGADLGNRKARLRRLQTEKENSNTMSTFLNI